VAADRRRDRRDPVQLPRLRLAAGRGGGNNDIDLLLACSIVAVVIVLTTQLISDIGYVYLNPRIRVSG
jgi:ABC-type microcin C transport system permease subunit YejB